jgi:hypothetical protein
MFAETSRGVPAAAANRGSVSWRDLVWPCLALGALGLALLGQTWLDDPAHGSLLDPFVCFIVAAALWLGVLWRGQRPLRVDDGELPIVPGPTLDRRRRNTLATGIGLIVLTALVAPLLFGHAGGGLSLLRYPNLTSGADHSVANGDAATNAFTLFGAWLWCLGMGLYVLAVASRPHVQRRWRTVLRRPGFRFTVTWTALAVLAIMVLGGWYRFHDLSGVPRDMTSDHTETVLDVADVSGGLLPVYLPRNGGREPLAFYWLALLAHLGLANGFMLLKVGMGLISTLTIPVLYLLGKRVAGREVGLLAALALALSYWHIVITRIGLQIAFAPLFVALVLVWLYRALETGRRNDFLALGFFLGAGLYGTAGFRPMLVVVPLLIGLKLAHDASRRHERGAPAPVISRDVAGHLAAAAGMTTLVATPLIRFAVDQPDAFWGRAAAGTASPLWQQLQTALLMFNLTSDPAWFQSAPGKPALEAVGGALLILGVVTAFYRLFRRDWKIGSLLVVIPIMLLASVLALSSASENPSLTKSAGVLPVIAIVMVLALPVIGQLWSAALGRVGLGVYALVLVGLFMVSAQNTTHRYFVDYGTSYNTSAQNASEGAAVAAGFMASGVPRDHIYVVGWENGWDYRAVGIQLGDPGWHGLLWGQDPHRADAVKMATAQPNDTSPRLYLVGGPLAASNVKYLRGLFPRAIAALHASAQAGREFWSVYVPGSQAEDSGG